MQNIPNTYNNDNKNIHIMGTFFVYYWHKYKAYRDFKSHSFRTDVWPKQKSWISTICLWAARRPTLERLWLDTTSSKILGFHRLCSSVFTSYSSLSFSNKMSLSNPKPRTIIYLICWMCPIVHTLTLHINSVTSCWGLCWFGIFSQPLLCFHTLLFRFLVRQWTNSVRWQ